MDLIGMGFKNKILIASGCSFTGGGFFNCEPFFLKEFPNHSNLIKTGIFGSGVLDDNNEQFKKLYRDYLWPHQLGKKLGTKKTYNLAAPGKGIPTTITNLYNCIFREIENGESAENLIIIYQIPSFYRDETIINEYNDHENPIYVSILTEYPDRHILKQEYINLFYNTNFLYKNYITELYKFKKFCDLLKINLICFSWETGNLDFSENNILNEYMDEYRMQLNNSSNTIANENYLISYKSFDLCHHLDIKFMIDEINLINFDGLGLQEYSIKNKIPNFNFKLKYPKETDDVHPTTEGCKFISDTLFEKISK